MPNDHNDSKLKVTEFLQILKKNFVINFLLRIQIMTNKHDWNYRDNDSDKQNETKTKLMATQNPHPQIDLCQINRAKDKNVFRWQEKNQRKKLWIQHWGMGRGSDTSPVFLFAAVTPAVKLCFWPCLMFSEIISFSSNTVREHGTPRSKVFVSKEQIIFQKRETSLQVQITYVWKNQQVSQ